MWPVLTTHPRPRSGRVLSTFEYRDVPHPPMITGSTQKVQGTTTGYVRCQLLAVYQLSKVKKEVGRGPENDYIPVS